jgi:shikimate kinase
MSGLRAIHNLALIGFMGTGKSSVGRLVAATLQFDFVDTDELIEKRSGNSINQIFAQSGEPGFRVLERQLVTEMVGWRETVISTGGGLAANESNLASLKQHALVVCLWAPPETIWQRVRNQTHRPLLQNENPLARIEALVEERRPYYQQADVLVNTVMRSVKEVAQQVMHQFHLARHRGARNENSH